MNIYLCGMIGSGKTAVGIAISRQLQWPFFDLDQVMEGKAGKRIHDIVAGEGWVSYREREYNICKRLSKLDHAVVAFAGGTVWYEWNMDVLKGTGVTVLLNARIPLLVQRAIRHDRPRVNPVGSLKEDLSLLWKKYKDRYQGAANLIYRTDRNKTVKEETEEIIGILRKKKLFVS